MTNPELTLIAALLDRTGSMESSKKATEDGFNELISAQKADPGQAIVTLAQFDKYNDAPVPEFVYQNKAINDVPKLALIPRGTTPLLDATGAFITQIGQDLSELEDNHRPGLVICVIMTDGLENASREWTWESVQALIKQQSEVYNWKFMFLGANIDAVKVAGDMGIAGDAAITFNSTDYDANRSVYAATSANLSGMRRRSQTSANFTPRQRDEAMGNRGKSNDKTAKGRKTGR